MMRAILLSILLSTLAMAQPARLEGRVVRYGYIPVPGARVEYTNTITQNIYVTWSDSVGHYEIDNILLPVAERPASEAPARDIHVTQTSSEITFSAPIPIRSGTVYDRLGRVVAELATRNASGGFALWDMRSSSGFPVSSGIYFATLKTAQGTYTARISHFPLSTESAKTLSTIRINDPQKSRSVLDDPCTIELLPDSVGSNFIPTQLSRVLRPGDNGFVFDTVQAREPHRILFVGNSYTYFNSGLDVVLRNFVRAADSTIQLTTSNATVGGYTFQAHWNDANTRNAILQGWDVVVLQDQSFQPAGYPATTLRYADSLNALIRSIGAEPTFFMTWGYASRPLMIDSLASTYTRCGRRTRAPVAPVGRAWQLSQSRNPSIILHISDGSHPTVHGTYLAACVFYATLFGRSPVGVEYVNDASITAAERDALQRTAWDAVQGYLGESVR